MEPKCWGNVIQGLHCSTKPLLVSPKKQGNLILGLHQPSAVPLVLQHPSLVIVSLMFWATEKKKISVPITPCGSENLNQNLQTLELAVMLEAVNVKAPI